MICVSEGGSSRRHQACRKQESELGPISHKFCRCTCLGNLHPEPEHPDSNSCYANRRTSSLFLFLVGWRIENTHRQRQVLASRSLCCFAVNVVISNVCVLFACSARDLFIVVLHSSIEHVRMRDHTTDKPGSPS